jgi:ketosteroid isomerase-like protein
MCLQRFCAVEFAGAGRDDDLNTNPRVRYGGFMTMSDLDQARERYRRSVAAFIRGDSEASKPLWSTRDDVTLANPLGPPAKGFEGVCDVMDRAAALIREGEGYSFETISVVETTELAYEVGIERNLAKLGDSTEKVPMSLRVTTVFRREDGEWKIVHRHADSITGHRSVDSI